MKRIEDALLMSPTGMRPAITYDVWNKTIGGISFQFALHADPTPGQPFLRDLRISELSTGLDTGTKVTHPVHGVQLTEAALATLTTRRIKQSARAALHSKLCAVGHANFVTAVLKGQIQAAKMGVARD